jgi:hypothetical protein
MQASMFITRQVAIQLLPRGRLRVFTQRLMQLIGKVAIHKIMHATCHLTATRATNQSCHGLCKMLIHDGCRISMQLSCYATGNVVLQRALSRTVHATRSAMRHHNPHPSRNHSAPPTLPLHPSGTTHKTRHLVASDTAQAARHVPSWKLAQLSLHPAPTGLTHAPPSATLHHSSQLSRNRST